MTAKLIPFDVLKSKLLADPAVKAAYDAQEAEYEAVRLEILKAAATLSGATEAIHDAD
jgi:hypothetical protein